MENSQTIKDGMERVRKHYEAQERDLREKIATQRSKGFDCSDLEKELRQAERVFVRSIELAGGRLEKALLAEKEQADLVKSQKDLREEKEKTAAFRAYIRAGGNEADFEKDYETVKAEHAREAALGALRGMNSHEDNTAVESL